MTDSIDSIRQRLELADSLPETFSKNNAAMRWREDVTTLLAEIERLREELETSRPPYVKNTLATLRQELTEAKATIERLSDDNHNLNVFYVNALNERDELRNAAEQKA